MLLLISMGKAKALSYLVYLSLMAEVYSALTAVDLGTACFFMKLLSPAKLNLGLWIVGRRPDGYHLLESLFWPIDLFDEIEIEPSPTNLVAIENVDPRDNTVFKLLEQNPKLGKWAVSIKKRIPMGAGLGGGSSNAGTILRYFVKSGLVTTNEAKEIALKLGADVPFFLNPVPSWVSGIGEICAPLDLERNTVESIKFLLIFPNIHCSTPIVFKRYKEMGQAFSIPPENRPSSSYTLENFAQFLQNSENALEQTVIQMEPVIKEGLQTLRDMKPVNAALSGSGSTFYATYLSDAQCEKNAKDVQQFCRKHHCRYIRAASYQGEHHGNHRGQSIPGK